MCDAPDTRLPITLLVEEGKHATAPDRDGDGEFKPHSDVNVNSNDGWGVHDTAATKRLGGATFRAEMSKSRVPGPSRVFPDQVPARLMIPFLIQEFPGRLSGSQYYKLISSVDSDLCENNPSGLVEEVLR